MRDRLFLERVFQKLLLNFTWWVNRKDVEGNNLFGGRLPRPRQHRGVRPLATAARRGLAGAGRRHRVDGVLLRHHALDRARARGRGPGLRGRGLQVLRALRRHRGRHERPRRRRACGTRRTGSTTTRSTSDGLHVPIRLRSMVGLIPLFAVRGARRGGHRPAARVLQAHALVPGAPPRPRAPHRLHGDRPGRGPHAPAARDPVAGRGSSGCCATCSTRTSSSRRTASARCRASTATDPTRSRLPA